MNVTLVRTAVIGGTTLLGLGLAGPALACMTTQDGAGSTSAAGLGTHGPSADDDELSVADYQAKVDAKLARLEAKLTESKARIADSTRLTDAEKADKTARIDELLTKVAALRVQVAGETTVEAIKADLKAAFAPDVDDVKARIDAKLGAWIDRLDAWEAEVAADPDLDADAKAEKLAKLQAWEDKALALRAEIAAATTLEEVNAALQAAGLDPFGRMNHVHGNRGGHDRSGRGGDASDHRTKHGNCDDVACGAATVGPLGPRLGPRPRRQRPVRESGLGRRPPQLRPRERPGWRPER